MNNQLSQPPEQVTPTPKSGISHDRIINFKDISIIEELIKCSICQQILNNPFECETCGSLFCEDCINDWLKIKTLCPTDCANFKISKAKINTRKMLSKLKLKCINHPNCNYTSDYWGIFDHEPKCQFQKILCPNSQCRFTGHFKVLKEHLKDLCEYMVYECSFCKSKIKRIEFEEHWDAHYKEKSFSVLKCGICESSENLRKCWCKKSICSRCILLGKNIECLQNCYVYQTGLKTATMTYSISKYALPKNCEVKWLFNTVDWVRTGITFSPEIVAEQNDVNCPPFDVYCILEDLVQFYTLGSGWKNCFLKRRELRPGDFMTIILKNGELRYEVNDVDLGGVIKIDISKKQDAHWFIHCRNNKTKVDVVYISEIFN